MFKLIQSQSKTVFMPSAFRSVEGEKKSTTKLKITTPQPSPKATVEQRVGLTDISS